VVRTSCHVGKRRQIRALAARPPVAIVIGDTLFMHGGPSRVLSGLSLEEINRRHRSALSEYLASLDALVTAGLVDLEDPFADPRGAGREAPCGVAPRKSRGYAARAQTRCDGSPQQIATRCSMRRPELVPRRALCNERPKATSSGRCSTGSAVKRLVIGHTVTRNQRVVSRFNGAVIKLDTGMNAPCPRPPRRTAAGPRRCAGRVRR